jgi:hypothetical protein
VIALRVVLDAPRLIVPERPALNLRAEARSVVLLRRITVVFSLLTRFCARCKLVAGEAVLGRALGVRAARRMTPRDRPSLP